MAHVKVWNISERTRASIASRSSSRITSVGPLMPAGLEVGSIVSKASEGAPLPEKRC